MANEFKRAVTERDFRLPEFRDAKPEDYEFRASDGKIVRKDRWEMGIQRIRELVGIRYMDDWEITDVIAAVQGLVEERQKVETTD